MDLDILDIEEAFSEPLALNICLAFKAGPNIGLFTAVRIIATCNHEASRRRYYGLAGEDQHLRLAHQAEIIIVELLTMLDNATVGAVLKTHRGNWALVRAVRHSTRRLVTCLPVQIYIRGLF